MRRRIGAVIATVTATVTAMTGSLLVAAPVPALAVPAVVAAPDPTETMLTADSPYLATRVAEPTDTDQVVVAMEWYPTVSGTVTGGQVCVDLPVPLPIGLYLWNTDGVMLASAANSEAGGYRAPCFHIQAFYPPVRVEANQHYVIGAWLMRGQYSYVPNGFDHEVSNVASGGHLVAPAADAARIGNGLYTYAPCCQWGAPVPTSTWERADYLVSPLFVPDAG